MTGRLENKVALITGTAQGQGRVAALRFAKEGAKIVGCDLNAGGNRETVRRVRENGGEMVSIEPLDLCKPDEVKKLVNLTEETYGRLDILYHNASAPRFAMLTEMSQEDWQFTIDNELSLVFYVVKAAILFVFRQHRFGGDPGAGVGAGGMPVVDAGPLSITTTFAPRLAALIAAWHPATPPPMTRTSEVIAFSLP